MQLKDSELVELNSCFLQKSSEKSPLCFLKVASESQMEFWMHSTSWQAYPEKVWLPTNTRCHDKSENTDL